MNSRGGGGHGTWNMEVLRFRVMFIDEGTKGRREVHKSSKKLRKRGCQRAKSQGAKTIFVPGSVNYWSVRVLFFFSVFSQLYIHEIFTKYS